MKKMHTVLLVMIEMNAIKRVVMHHSFQTNTHFSPSMIMSKQHRCIIYEVLFNGAFTTTSRFCSHSRSSEGVLVAKKELNALKYEKLEVPNLKVIKVMQSLTLKGYVKTQFSWQWYYYVLMPEGVEYLCYSLPQWTGQVLKHEELKVPNIEVHILYQIYILI